MKIQRFNENVGEIVKYAILMNDNYLIQGISINEHGDENVRFDETNLLDVLKFYDEMRIMFRREKYTLVKVAINNVTDDEIEMVKYANKYNL